MLYQETVIGFHDKLIAENGVNDASGFSEQSQRKRFDVFAEYLPNRRVTLLDYGCGSGKFYVYLTTRGMAPPIEYFGMDVNQKVVEHAMGLHSQRFEVGDILDDEVFALTPHSNWIVASGVLCYKHPEAGRLHLKLIQRLWDRCSDGLMFNVLSSLWPHAAHDKHTIYSPEEVCRWLDVLKCRRFELRHNYLDNDMTMVCFK